MVIKSKNRRKAGGAKMSSGLTSERSKRSKGQSTLLVVIGIISLGVFGISTWQIMKIFNQSSVEKAERLEIFSTLEMDNESQFYVIPYDELLEKNPDFVSWIDIPNTSICYPVVYSPISNDVYIRTSFNKTYAVSGSIFVDYRCNRYFSDRMTIIYGHRMNDNTMFAQLKSYLVQSFYEDHKEIHIYTPKGIEIYRVFSAYTADVTEDAIDSCYTLEFDSDKDFISWGNEIKGKSAIRTTDTVASDSKVILLSTCVWNQSDKRNVVLAVYSHTEPNP